MLEEKNNKILQLQTKIDGMEVVKSILKRKTLSSRIFICKLI